MTEKFSSQVIIVGSGVAGAMCAYGLAKKGIEVTILEAGPRITRQEIVAGFQESEKLDLSAGYPNQPWAPRPDWGSGKVKDEYVIHNSTNKLKMEYLRVVGGTTWHWSANAIRLLPSDFEMLNKYGVGRNWPISYADIERYYGMAEEEMGVSGDDNDETGSPRSTPYPMPPIPPSYSDKFMAKKLKNIGLYFTTKPVARNSIPYDDRPQCQGFGTCSPICPIGAQYSADVHIKKAEKLGVRVVDNARVDKLIADKYGHITRVEFTRSDNSKGIAVGEKVIMAANGMEIPKLLLMSANDDFKNGLANSSGQVGRNHMDHPGIYSRMILPEPLFVGRGPASIMTCNVFRDGAFRSSRSALALSVNHRSHFYGLSSRSVGENLVGEVLDETIRYRTLHHVEIDVHMEKIPSFDNGITLDWGSLDSSGQPKMDLTYDYSDYDKKGFNHARSILWEISKELGALETKIGEPFSHHHLMGMTRMGDDKHDSVVDKNCRTFDHDNLFLLSSSVFPTSGTANPTLTIVALALRLADHIAESF